jgi:hypothetical protein
MALIISLVDIAKETISELEYMTLETTQNEVQGNNRNVRGKKGEGGGRKEKEEDRISKNYGRISKGIICT